MMRVTERFTFHDSLATWRFAPADMTLVSPIVRGLLAELRPRLFVVTARVRLARRACVG